MFTRLTVKNFRSLGEVTLDLSPYTVIVGQNRAGKSNTLRAFRALFTNATGDDFIRQGQTSCLVEVETSEGYIVRWEKSKDGAKYTIIHEGEEDRVFSKLAGQVPPEVQAIIGVRMVEIDSTTSIWPQVHQQGEFAFLIKPHLTSGQAARAIAKLTRLDVVVKAQQLCKSLLRDLNSTLKEETRAVASSEKELEEFQHLPQEAAFLDDVVRERRALGESLNKYVDANLGLKQYDEASDAANLFIPNQEDLTEIESTLDTLDACLAVIDIVDGEVPVDLPTVEALRDKLLLLVNGTELYECYCNATEELGNLNVASVVMFGEQKEIEQELDKLKGGTCPVCGGVMGEHFV